MPACSYARHKVLAEKQALAQRPVPTNADTVLNNSGEDDAVDPPLPTHDASVRTRSM